MFGFLVVVLISGGLVLFGWVTFDAFGRIAAHLRGSPEAAKAFFEHVFLPLLGNKPETDRKPSSDTAMVLHKESVSPTGSE